MRGYGKTTMTCLINGMISDYYDGELKGEILVNGINQIGSPLYEISDMVGAVFQNPHTQFYAVNTTRKLPLDAIIMEWSRKRSGRRYRHTKTA